MLKLDDVGGIGATDLAARGVMGFDSRPLDRVVIGGGNSGLELWVGDIVAAGGT